MSKRADNPPGDEPSAPVTRRKRVQRPPHSPDPGGRPTKLTEDTIRALEEAFAAGATRGEACAAAGISTAALGMWLVREKLGHGGRYAELGKRVRKAEARYRRLLQGVVLKSVQDRPTVFDAEGNVTLPGRRGDWRAAIALLDRLDARGVIEEDPVEADAPGPAAGSGVPDVIDAEEIPADADDVAVLEARVRSYRRQVAAATADGNHPAAAAFSRRLERAEDELRVMRRERRDEGAEGNGGPALALPEDELRARIREAAEGMPEDHLAIVVGVYLERHRLRLVRDETAGNALIRPAEDEA